MSPSTALDWLPAVDDWLAKIKAAEACPKVSWSDLTTLASARLDFTRTNRLDQLLRRSFGSEAPGEDVAPPVRLALLGSSTLLHLHAGIRVAALRRGMWVSTYENGYGQYFQELLDSKSALHRFKPTVVLFAFDVPHVTASANAALEPGEARAVCETVYEKMSECWRIAREAFGCPIIQQTLLPIATPVLGNNEQRLPGSRAAMVERINAWLRGAADEAGVDLLSLDASVAQDGVAAWHDTALWHRSKQEVSPKATPMYGDLVARLVAARAGRSKKCLVLDLDNTLWGGVIGDDGLDGIVLGQGNPLGEAYVGVQNYARELSRRGVILAVCSKNDDANAVEAFDKHPEMTLTRKDIACFKANWNDKAQNIRAIAEEINIGLDAIVFLDDNPFERALVRRELPMVAVPEVGDDPTFYPQIIGKAGYFEGLAVSLEDKRRSSLYQANLARKSFSASGADLEGYLRGLEMELSYRKFDEVGLQRIVQLINKTNQFNLTTKRYDEAGVRAVIADPNAFGLQLRLTDRFGDNGMVSVVIGRGEGKQCVIDTWLMSCRVLGRSVESATLGPVTEHARALGADRLIGLYRPTKKNGMVKDHYQTLGFRLVKTDEDGGSQSVLDLDGFTPSINYIRVLDGAGMFA